jgi:CTP:molybdopterin cytidylyltransferase MocA
VRGVALDKIAALVRLHGDTPVSTATLRDILNASNKAIDAARHNYEAKVKQIEEAYK